MKTAIAFSFKTTRTSAIAEKIQEHLKSLSPDFINVNEMNPEVLSEYDLILAGVPTWFDGELPFYWDEWLPALEDIDFAGKKFAIFGLADQIHYPDNFADAVGIFAQFVRRLNGEVIGLTSAENYQFRNSKALENGKFLGLILDEDNEAEKSNERIEQWCSQILASVR